MNKIGLYWITWKYEELSKKGLKSRALGLQDFLVEGVSDDEDREVPGKEFIFLNQDDDEDQVDNEPDDTNTCLTKLIGTRFDDNIRDSSYMLDDESNLEIGGEAIPTSSPASNNFEHVADFEELLFVSLLMKITKHWSLPSRQG
ncbi:uncharacterized protein A4U43_C05F11940 [Asparagus officinalis]|uniref:Uncharacterized protein n=1 Tax=Asparagus officinalis TaxID=4686 RepID=A0A5P1ETN2_ASPOF|nr:uncharacterized protein A4U43_C05F11940 [Asparagus officinalis]